MVSRTRGMVSKRSSEWSVKSRSSLTWIDAPKTVEAEHGGPWYIVRYDNPPMVLNPLETSSYTLRNTTALTRPAAGVGAAITRNPTSPTVRVRWGGQESLQDVDGDGESAILLVVVEIEIGRGIDLEDDPARLREGYAGVARDDVDPGEPDVEGPGGARPVFDDRVAEQVRGRGVVGPAVLVDDGLQGHGPPFGGDGAER